MADTVKKPAAATPDLQFNITDFMSGWEKQNKLRAERQKQESIALENTQGALEQMGQVQQNALRENRNFVSDLKPIVDEHKTLEEARQRQMKLSTSGNFVDNLQAMQDAMLSPQTATSDGRARTRAELNSSISILATLHSAQQSVFNDQIQMINTNTKIKNAGFEKAQLAEKSNQEAIEAEANRVATIVNGLSANKTARELILGDMTYDQVKQASTDAKKNGKTVVNGFEFSPQVLDQQMTALEDAAYTHKSAMMASQLKDMETQAAMAKRQLRYLTTDQLNRLVAGQDVVLKSPDGDIVYKASDFALGDLKAESETKTALAEKDLNTQKNNLLYGDIRQDIVSKAEYYKSIMARTPKNDPLHMTAVQRLTELNQSYNVVDTGERAVAQTGNMDQFRVLTETKQAIGVKLDKQFAEDQARIDKYAKIAGKSNEHLTNANRDFLNGQPVMESDVVEFATKKLVEGLPPSDIFPPAIAQAVKKNMDEMLNARRPETQMSMGDSIKDKELKTMIAQGAIQKTISEQAQSKTTDFIGNQADRKYFTDPIMSTNPIMQLRRANGEMMFDSNRWLSFVKTADDKGLERYQMTRLSPLSSGQIDQLQAGKDITLEGGEVITASRFQQDLSLLQNQALLFDLESTQPGLSEKYIKWWSDNGETYAQQFIRDSLGPDQASNVQDAAVRSLSASSVQNGVVGYMQGIVDAYPSFKEDQKARRKQWVSYDLDPMNRQAALLQFDSTLEDDDRTVLMRDLIMPALADIKKQSPNIEFEDANIAIDDVIKNAQDGDLVKQNPALKRALSKMLANRGAASRNLEAGFDVPWLYGNDKIPDASLWDRITEKRDISSSREKWEGIRQHGKRANPVVKKRMIFDKPFFSLNPNEAWLSSETSSRPYDWYVKLRSKQ